MLTLGISTISREGCLAIIDENGIVCAERAFASKSSLSLTLLPEIVAILKEQSLELSDISLFSMTIGPGSFTSLRIGLAAVKGLMYGLPAPLVGVSSLEAVAASVNIEEGVIVPLLDAKKGEVYCGVYQKSGEKTKPLLEDIALKPEECLSMIAQKYPKAYFVGDGFEQYKEVLKGCNEVLSVANTAASTARLGLREWRRGNVEGKKTTLNYCRKSEAEVNKNLFLRI